MRLYLDVCAMKRPFDDISHPRVEAEARAVVEIMEAVCRGDHVLIWSNAIAFENQADPDEEIRDAIAKLEEIASEKVLITESLLKRFRDLHQRGVSPLDAAHLAFAEEAGCDVLITCDDRFMRRAGRCQSSVRVVNPVQWLQEVDDG